jgi:7-cyano-7-deazaguanine reductase
MASHSDDIGLPDDAVLRSTVRHPVDHLDIIERRPSDLREVRFECAEIASMCPVTEQPDTSTVTITYSPADGRLIESKSLKLYLWGFRDRGVFCEQMAEEILGRVMADAAPAKARVEVCQSARGGIVTTAIAAAP